MMGLYSINTEVNATWEAQPLTMHMSSQSCSVIRDRAVTALEGAALLVLLRSDKL